MSYSLRDETNSQGIMVPWSAQPASIIFDPHMHTRYSDGNLSVEELVKLASTNKCNAIAITDHADTQGTFVQQRSNDIATARENYPEMFIFKGIELNPPSYQGREHINLFGTPDVEDSLIARVQPAQSKDAMANKNDSALLNALATLDSEQVVAIYNHPSRKDLRREENLFDYEKWSAESDVFIGFEGAPGHQKSPTVGSYKSLFKTIYRWDPVVSTPNGTWDKLLDKGRQVWAALASSDFHNSDLDYPPCDFARVHLRVPEYSYSGIIQALRTGTFWADHGKLLEKFDFSIFLNDTQTTVFPGEISQNVARYSTALMQFDLRRFEDKVGLPLMLDVYTNCTEGNPQRYEMGTLDAYSSYAEFALPLQMTGADKRTCFVRARVSLQNSEFGPVYAYSNPIRITLD